MSGLHCVTVFTDLAGISASLLSHVCASVGMSPGRVQLLCESPSQAPSSGAYSMSNLTLFHYAAQRAVDRDGDQAEAVPIAAEVSQTDTSPAEEAVRVC